MGCFSSTSKKVVNPNKSDISVNASTFIKAGQGTIHENYTISKTLGSGAFADVKLCIHKPTSQKRAVKFIHKSGLHQQQMDPQVFLQQVKVLKQLDHPNILRCFEIFEDRKNFYVSTEFCEGGELFDKIIELKYLNQASAAEIMFQLLSAIAYCHDRMVIHRDLKPENILLEESGASLSIKVADFGSSCFIDTGKRLSGCFGSAYYVAPEVLMGEYNEKCDVWSTGVIMFILLTGRPPYPGNDQNHILRLVKTNPLQVDPQRFTQLSREAISLLQCLLQVDVKRRISAKEAVNHPWIRKNYRNNKAMPNIADSLENLKGFYSSCKLKDAVHIYIATQIISHQDLKQLKESFQTIDINGDGRLSMQELLEAYKKQMGLEEAKQEVERIMRHVDDDHSGDIDYSEFLKACMNDTKYMSQQNLETAFKLFDTDGSGDITVDELKKTLAGGTLYEEEVWQKIIREVDENGDGVIDLKEFKNLMTALNK